MKTIKLDGGFELDFLILGINSHTKLYKLCWEINKKLYTNFVKNKNHTTENNQEFERFSYTDKNSETKYNILSTDTLLPTFSLIYGTFKDDPSSTLNCLPKNSINACILFPFNN